MLLSFSLQCEIIKVEVENLSSKFGFSFKVFSAFNLFLISTLTRILKKWAKCAEQFKHKLIEECVIQLFHLVHMHNFAM